MKQIVSRSLLMVVLCAAVSTPTVAHGYFLDAAQKRDLLMRGQMTDDDGRLYDVWIVPGYVGPVQDGRKGWSDAGDSLADYGRPKFYDDIGQSSRDVWRLGTHDTLRDFALRGTRQAWKDDMSLAQQRTERRVFGWWLAYPWGIFEALGSSIVRLGGGIPTGLLISASAYTVVPVVNVMVPVPKSMWQATAQGLAYPAAAMGWNTFVAPPLALLGQEPAPERADGFWLKMVSAEPPTAEGIKDAAEATAAWRTELLEAVPADSLDAEVAKLEREKEAGVNELQAQIRTIEQDAQAHEAEARELWLKALYAAAMERRAQLRADLRAHGFPEQPTAAERQALQATLVGDRLQASEAEHLLDLVLGEPGEPRETQAPRPIEKTDPLKRSLEILENP
jgi:hypothetical protein